MRTRNSNEKPLLRVEHLEQYFKLGKSTLKAVDDVNFSIYRGEVFSLVGESGCGKTTTGRSIIRLYDINGGSVYYDGKRIAAGTRRYIAAMKEANKAAEKRIKDLEKAMHLSISLGEDVAKATEEYKTQAAKITTELEKFHREQIAEIKSAKYDHKNCNKEFANYQVKLCKEKFEPQIKDLTEKVASTNDEGIKAELVELKKRYKAELRLAKKDRIMNKIQMIFQDPIASLDPRMTVHDIIAEGLKIRGIHDKEYIDEQVYRVLDLVGLVSEHASRYPHEFSGGQRQRIGIARAIVLNPELIIADEPVSALDVSIQAQVINLLNELREKMGLTVLFIAHDLSVVKYFSDRIAVMYFGHIVEEASSDDLFKNPLHPYTRSLLSAIPLPDPRYEKKRKRITYNPLRDHDYSKEGPEMREIRPGHFVSCNSEEFARYNEEYKD